MDLVRHHHRQRRETAQRRLVFRPSPRRVSRTSRSGIPTFNRPHDCVNALRDLTADPLVDKVIGAVIVTDQGTSKMRDHPDFAAAAAVAG